MPKQLNLKNNLHASLRIKTELRKLLFGMAKIVAARMAVHCQKRLFNTSLNFMTVFLTYVCITTCIVFVEEESVAGLPPSNKDSHSRKRLWFNKYFY